MLIRFRLLREHFSTPYPTGLVVMTKRYQKHMERKEKIAGKKIVALISIWYIAFHAKYCNAQFQEDNRTIPYQATSR